ncbi:unnamed protein product [Aspergillus oryzae RIB40]|uniref:DNA, SC012 n=1 Tax=Aspergillus oryzae (strain ATCC 42149 / RIB 40) TaxID=510516 RepID=Q2UDR1_ASPOR|nr:unnamed protein product [Aspergillus oryzae RIB40]BAE60304.1 unnamed protein product [Aspergillus oryzae RIB40]
MALFGTARTPAIPEWITNAVVHTSAVLGPINQNLVSTSISDTSIGAATERPISVPLTNLVVMCSAASECSNSEKGYNCNTQAIVPLLFPTVEVYTCGWLIHGEQMP